MGSGFSFESTGISPARFGIFTMCFKFDGDMDNQPGTLTPLPNIVCTDVEWSEGAEPGAARFRYVFDEILGDPAWPSRVEHAYPLDARNPYVLRPDDRIVVYRGDESGETQLIFDGYTQLPQADLSDRMESVTFTALGTQIRQWDRALRGAYMRDMDDPEDFAEGSDVQTDRDARFNPDGHPNASPEDADAYIKGSDDQRYPTFFGPIYPATEMNGEEPRLWTLGMAFRYILARGCVQDDGTVTRWFRIKDWQSIDDSLKAIVPKEDGRPIRWPDPSTFDLQDIIVQDLSVTGDAWPVAAQKLLEPHGFTMLFRLRTGEDGLPEWWLEVYRKDTNLPLKPLLLQAAGSTLDPGLNNLWKLRLARDSKAIKNRVVVDAAPTRYEAAFVLAQMFEPDEADAAGDARGAFKGAQRKAGTAEYRKYREWGMDEAGEGHWVEDGSGWVTDPGDLDPLFNPPLTDEEKAAGFVRPDRPFVVRRRKPIGTLISRGTDEDDNPTVALKAELWVSRDYEAGEPALWDGSGTWHKVPDGAWNLLPDRIGVRIVDDDLEGITIGDPDPSDGDGKIASKKINIIKSIADPTEPANPYLWFRLTCVVEDDLGLPAVAARRPASPQRYEIERRVDARDRFRREVISKFSQYNALENILARDDFVEALDYARSLRRANERASFSGTATCPRFTDAYEIGDKLGGVVGRGLSLRTNAGGEQGESDTFPVVVAIRYTFEGDEQSTQLTLSDHRAEPARRRQR